MIKILVLLVAVYSSISYAAVVRCDHTTSVCECGASESVCEFNLDIDMLHTFTRYEVERKFDSSNNSYYTDSRGNAGRTWYIDTNGDEQPFVDSIPDLFPVCNKTTDICTEASYIDGQAFRSFIGVNSRIPGPTLIVTQDQLLEVTVNNRLASESISVHWHGMHQRESNWMDGVEHVTQCGILPGGSFTYTFTATQSGTHWYHSHSGAQRTDGLFGALIVQEKTEDLTRIKEKLGVEDFEDKPESHTLTLWDWQNSNSIDLFTHIRSGIRHFEQVNGREYIGTELSAVPQPRTYSSDDAEVGPVPFWSGLINGRGRYRTVDYKRTRLSIFTVSPGNMYRFRLIGAQSLYAFRVSVDEHKLQLIATDGVFVNETNPVDYIIVHSGERYDFLLETKSAADVEQKTNFLIRGETLERDVPYSNKSVEAILHYDTGNNSEPSSTDYSNIAAKSEAVGCSDVSPCIAVNCPFENYPPSANIKCLNIHQLQLLEPFEGDLPDVAVPELNKLILNFGFEGSRETSAINGRNLKLPSLPLVMRESDRCALDNTTSAECDDNKDTIISDKCYCTHIRDVAKDKYIQLVLSAVGPEPATTRSFRFSHPVHLHGHYFHVVNVSYGEYDDSFKLTRGNDAIDCGGTNLCVNPTWKPGRDYAYGRTGKISALAPLKDTVMVPYGGYVVVYFKADNPGYWFLHCHIEVHQLEGMGVVIRAGERSTHTSLPSDFPTCDGFMWPVTPWKTLFIIFLALFIATLIYAAIVTCILLRRCKCSRKGGEKEVLLQNT